MPRLSNLASVFDPRRNSLNAIRLALATAVIVSHAWPIGGYGEDPGFGDQDLGDWAVAGFFTVSGYLITMSRERSRSFLDFVWRRFLRIYPGFLVVLLVGAFVFAPVSVLFAGGTYSIGLAAMYVVKNLGLFIGQYFVPGTLPNAPYPNSLNGALWTLFYEFLCYLGIGLLVSLVPRRFRGAALVAIFVLGTAATMVFVFGHVPFPDKGMRVIRLGTFFAAGALLYTYRRSVPFSPWLTVLAGLLTVGVILTGTFQALAGLPVAYLLMSGAVVLPLSRVGAKNDISYGMYIYAFPIEQLLAALLPNRAVPVWLFAVLAIAATIPFAWASWLLVERPAMRLKSLTARSRVDREGHVEQAVVSVPGQ